MTDRCFGGYQEDHRSRPQQAGLAVVRSLAFLLRDAWERCDKIPLTSGEEQTVGSEVGGEGTSEEATATMQARNAWGLDREGEI